MKGLCLRNTPDNLSPDVPDEEVLARVRSGQTEFYEILMRRHSPQLRRVARRILQNDADVEDLMQEAHFNALRHLDQFAGRSSFSTWLIRIAIHGAMTKLHRQPRFLNLDSPPLSANAGTLLASRGRDPEKQVLDRELRRLLRLALDSLPRRYRSVFEFREIEGMNTAQTAALLRISETCVKTRLHRAKSLLRSKLKGRLAPARGARKSFHWPRCLVA